MDDGAQPLTADERAVLDRIEIEMSSREPRLVARFERLSMNPLRLTLRRALSNLTVLVLVGVSIVIASYLFTLLALALASSAMTSRP